VTGFDKSRLPHTYVMARPTFHHHLIFTSMNLTNNPCVYHCQWFLGLLFLGLVSQACLTCLSGWVAFKWQWCDWTNTDLTGNHNMTGQKTWQSNWLLFVISRTQMDLRQEHLVVLNFYMWKNPPLCGSPLPLTSAPM